MTAISNYSNLIDNIFGVGTTKFDTTTNVTNSVINALNHPTVFPEFTLNFTARLERLRNIYSAYPKYLSEIIVQVNEIASVKNWEGAFAELAAFDHLNKDLKKTFIANPVKPNVTLDKSRTFALELGKSFANLDGYIEDRPLYLDVKCLKDNVNEILNGIYKELYSHFKSTDFKITAEYSLDISYDDFQSKRKVLLDELKRKIIQNETTSIESRVIKNLYFNILWGSGIQMTTRTYDPYNHAKNYHMQVFNYASKFVKDRPSIIVFVVFPWYNSVISDFTGNNIRFYRALSRRVFCQYKHDSTPFNSFNSRFSGNQTIYEVSTNLSGILFLEDKTILGEEPNNINVESFLYLNPNAIKSVKKSMARDYITGLQNQDYDDFEHDNY